MFTFLKYLEVQARTRYKEIVVASSGEYKQRNTPSTFIVAKNNYEDYIRRLKSYFYSSNVNAKNNNLFVQLLKTLSSVGNLDDVDKSIYEHSDLLCSEREFVERKYSITSVDIVGMIHNGNIFAGGNELMVSVDFGVDLFYLQNNWMDVSPIRILSTPYTDIQPIPNSINYERPIFAEIDLVLLGLQYSLYVKNRTSLGLTESVTKNNYVAKLVLPNIYGNLTNLSFLNRFYEHVKDNEYPNVPIKEVIYSSPVFFTSRIHDIDGYLGALALTLSKMRTTIPQAMGDIPVLCGINRPLDLLIPTGVYSNYQTDWVYWYGMIETVNNILTINMSNGNIMNQGAVKSFPTRIREFENGSSILWSILTDGERSRFESELSRLKQLCSYTR